MTSYRPAREESEHIIHMLVDKYPQCFFEQPSQRRPLSNCTGVSDVGIKLVIFAAADIE